MGNIASDRKNARCFSLKFSRNTDREIIEHLESQGNVQGYLKNLIIENMKGDTTMSTYETKFDVIKDLTDRGLFELADDIMATINADENPDHSGANKHTAAVVRSIRDMDKVTLFSAKELLDRSSRLYGFIHGLAYSDLDVVADVIDDVELLYEIAYQVCHIVISGK